MAAVAFGPSGSSELRGHQSVATDDRREPQGQSPGRSGEIRRRALIGRSEAESKVITASTMKKPLSNQPGVAVAEEPHHGDHDRGGAFLVRSFPSRGS